MYVNAMLNLTCQRLRALFPDWLNQANCFVSAGPVAAFQVGRHWLCVFYGGGSFEAEQGGNLGRKWRLGLAYYHTLSLDELERHTEQAKEINDRMRQIVGVVTADGGAEGLHQWQPLLAVQTGFLQNGTSKLLSDRTITSGAKTAVVLDVRLLSGAWADGDAQGDVILYTDLSQSWAASSPYAVNMAAYRQQTAISSVARLSGEVAYVQLAAQPVLIKTEQAVRVATEAPEGVVTVQQEYEVYTIDSDLGGYGAPAMPATSFVPTSVPNPRPHVPLIR